MKGLKKEDKANNDTLRTINDAIKVNNDTLRIINDSKAVNVLHSLEQYFYVNVDSNETFVTAGGKGDPFAKKFDIETIQAIQVALDTIGGENPEVFDTIYKPSDGTTLAFFANDTTFKVQVCDLRKSSFVRFIDEREYSTYEATKKSAGEEKAELFAPILIFTFPYSINKKEAVKMIDSVGVRMPHSIACIDGNHYFEKQTVTYLQ